MKEIVLIGVLMMCFSITSRASVRPITFELDQQVEYPEDASRNLIEGTVIAEFEIKDGVATNISIVQSVEKSLDDTVVKMVKELSAEQLIELRKCGKEVFRLPVNFNLI